MSEQDVKSACCLQACAIGAAVQLRCRCALLPAPCKQSLAGAAHEPCCRHLAECASCRLQLVGVLNAVPQQGRNHQTYVLLLELFTYFPKPMS